MASSSDQSSNDDDAWGVERILAQRPVRDNDGIVTAEYLVRWDNDKPYYLNDTWVAAKDFIQKETLSKYAAHVHKVPENDEYLSTDTSRDVANDILVLRSAEKGICPNGHSIYNKQRLELSWQNQGLKQTVIVSLLTDLIQNESQNESQNQ